MRPGSPSLSVAGTSIQPGGDDAEDGVGHREVVGLLQRPIRRRAATRMLPVHRAFGRTPRAYSGFPSAAGEQGGACLPRAGARSGAARRGSRASPPRTAARGRRHAWCSNRRPSAAASRGAPAARCRARASGTSVGPGDEVLDEVDRGVVRPVEVLEHEHRRSALRQPLDEPSPRGECLGPSDRRTGPPPPSRPTSARRCRSTHSASSRSSMTAATAFASLDDDGVRLVRVEQARLGLHDLAQRPERAARRHTAASGPHASGSARAADRGSGTAPGRAGSFRSPVRRRA